MNKTGKGYFEKGKSAFVGRKHSQKSKEKMKNTKKGKPSNAEGKHWELSGKTKRKMSLMRGGTGITQRPTKRYYHLRDWRYMEWRSKVFERDNWTCQTCWAKSGEGNPVYLEPHHIKGWAKYPKLRYKVENGVTLCRECHKLTRKKILINSI